MLCVDQLIVDRSCVFKQSAESGCLARQFDDRRLPSCFIVILVIYGHMKCKWLSPKDEAVTGGVDVFDSYTGDRDDKPDQNPVRFPLNQVGDCMILRGAYFANQTAAHKWCCSDSLAAP